MAAQDLPLFNYDDVQIGEELGSYEYELTQEMIDLYRKAVDDPDAVFPHHRREARRHLAGDGLRRSDRQHQRRQRDRPVQSARCPARKSASPAGSTTSSSAARSPTWSSRPPPPTRTVASSKECAPTRSRNRRSWARNGIRKARQRNAARHHQAHHPGRHQPRSRRAASSTAPTSTTTRSWRPSGWAPPTPSRPGRMSIAFCTEAMRKFIGADDFHRSGNVNLKFLRPVKHGDTVSRPRAGQQPPAPGRRQHHGGGGRVLREPERRQNRRRPSERGDPLAIS